MPAMHRPKKYGTARCSGTSKAFRGSARAWDSQRKGLLVQKTQAPAPQPIQNVDDSDEDTFMLESPPESPLVQNIENMIPAIQARLPIPPTPRQTFPSIDDVMQEESVIVVRSRQPLAQKPDSQLNQLPSTPQKRPKRKSRARKLDEAVCQPSPPHSQTEVEISERIDISRSTIESSGDHSNNEITIKTIETIETEFEVSLPSPSPLKATESFAVEIVCKPKAPTATSESEPTTESEEDEEEIDEALLISPQQREAMHNEARRRARPRRGPPIAVQKSNVVDDLQGLSLRTPKRTSVPSPAISGKAHVTPAPKVPFDVVTPPSEGILELSPQSQVFNLLPMCDKPRIISYAEYLASINPDFSHIKKIGESSFAEVFVHKNKAGKSVVLKLVPLKDEANALEVIAELKTTRALSPIDGFIKYLGCQVVCSGVPRELDAAWRVWEVDNNEKYTPSKRVFGETEYHAIIALEDGGCCLAEVSWSSWDVPLEIFRQTIKSFADAERQRKFEHRDLHEGNILVKNLKDEREGNTKVDSGTGRKLEIEKEGFEDVKVTTIDYTLSRAEIPEEFGGGVAFMEMEDGMFNNEGLYQFEMYKKVRDEVLRLVPDPKKRKGRKPKQPKKPNWSLYCPRSNVIWLHYMIKRLIRSDDNKRIGGKMRVRKPTKAKRNEFDLACWAKVMQIHDRLDKEVDEDWKFEGAVDIEKWCLEEGVFDVLEDERKRRAEAPIVIEEEEEVVEEIVTVRRSRRIREIRPSVRM